MENGTEVTLNLSSNLIGNCNDESNFPHNLLLTNTQFSRLHKAFASGSSANKTFSKTQFSKMIQSGGTDIRDSPIFGNILLSVAKRGTHIFCISKQINLVKNK